MLLGSDLAAALSSSRGTSPAKPASPAAPFDGGTGNPAMGQTPKRSPLAHNRSTTSILRPTNDCRHFHYETVELGPILVSLEADEKEEENHQDGEGGGGGGIDEAMKLRVKSNGKEWKILRTFGDICQLDCQLHRCIFSREHSRLEELSTDGNFGLAHVRAYLQRLSLLTGSLLRCYHVLCFFEVDNRGNHFHPAEHSQINIPAIACAVAIRPFLAQCGDQLDLRVGDIVSVVEMAEGSDWWRGKLTVPSEAARGEEGEEEGGKRQRRTMDDGATTRVGAFPSSSVRLFSDRLSLGEQIWLASQPKAGNRRRSSLLKHLSSPAPRLKSLLRLAIPLSPENVVFDKELVSFGQSVPPLVSECVAIIERKGMVPGIYRQCGVQSNIRRLRREFQHKQCPQWDSPQLALLLQNDIHSMASLIKQFFRQLPDPLISFHLHPRFIAAFADANRHSLPAQLAQVRSLVGELPPAHFQTARCLFAHLQRISLHPPTEMSPRNLAIVWAPNLLRCPPAQSGDWPNQLAGLDIHTDICAFLVTHADGLFEANYDAEEGEAKRDDGEKMGEAADWHKETQNNRDASIAEGVGPRIEGDDEERGKRRRKDWATTIGSPKWRRFLQNTSDSLEHSFNSILRRPSSMASPGLDQRSQSVDRTKEKRAPHRLLSPFGASVMRRVRSVRNSVNQKFRPSTAAAHSSPTSNGTIPFVDETRPSPSPSPSPSHLSTSETVKECGGRKEEERRRGRRKVNFEEEKDGGGSGREEEEGGDGAESVDSMPLDISRYDNVQSSIILCGGENRICSPAIEEVVRLKAKIRRPFSFEEETIDDETIYF